jgi:hypothetical protein
MDNKYIKICAQQMTIHSSAQSVTPYTHMMTASSTWCLRTITWILHLATWEQNWGICSTETKFWVSWQLRTAKCDKSNKWILILCLSVCFRWWMQQIYQRQLAISIGPAWASIVRIPGSDNSQDIKSCCNHSPIPRYIWHTMRVTM